MGKRDLEIDLVRSKRDPITLADLRSNLFRDSLTFKRDLLRGKRDLLRGKRDLLRGKRDLRMSNLCRDSLTFCTHSSSAFASWHPAPSWK
jgi:hypothetical protein